MSTFFDTNIFVYAASLDRRKEPAVRCLADGGTISVQVLNELINVLSKKQKRPWSEIEAILSNILERFPDPRPITAETTAAAVRLAADHMISFYDALIIASALEAKCTLLYTEDLQHGRTFGDLTISNPFKSN